MINPATRPWRRRAAKDSVGESTNGAKGPTIEAGSRGDAPSVGGGKVDIGFATTDEPQTVGEVLLALRGQLVPRQEVVIGLVGAMGTDMDRVTSVFTDALTSVNYATTVVHVSDLIRDYCESEGVVHTTARTALDELMDLGDALREALGHGSAAAALAVGEISAQRDVATGGVERSSVATIIRQLKHPKEVEVLRTVYGPRFVLVGAWSPRVEREANIERRLQDKHSDMGENWMAGEVRRLLLRDEKDASRTLGQRVRDTYELADAYLALVADRDPAADAARIVRLLFGSPFETPTREEQAMFIASGASLRSSDAGRQVGVAVIDEDGEVLVTGTNEIPKAGGGQYWEGDTVDRRDFKIGFDENEKQKHAILTGILQSLKDAGWLDGQHATMRADELAAAAVGSGGPLVKNRVDDLLEFARVAHAEMAAICTAARRGVALRGHTMYTTTYPCHQCARLVIAAGIVRVVYVDPYPKSKVPQMYRDEVSEEPTAVPGSVVKFEPFQGVAPRLYRSVFSATGRQRSDMDGKYLGWDRAAAQPRLGRDAMGLPMLATPEDALYDNVYEALGNSDIASYLPS